MADSSPRILKAHAARELPTRVTFNFEDLREQASAEMLRARQEAEAIRTQARQEAETLKKQALEDGRKAGLAEGLKTAQQQIEQQAKQLADQQMSKQLATVLPALQQAAQSLRDERDHWLLRWEQSAIHLGVAIAEKLLRFELAARPERAFGMIGEALQLAAGQPRLRVRLNPEDLERLGDSAAQIVQSLTTCAEAEVIGDETIFAGGCVIESRYGEVDARLETMLERITMELLAS